MLLIATFRLFYLPQCLKRTLLFYLFWGSYNIALTWRKHKVPNFSCQQVFLSQLHPSWKQTVHGWLPDFWVPRKARVFVSSLQLGSRGKPSHGRPDCKKQQRNRRYAHLQGSHLEKLLKFSQLAGREFNQNYGKQRGNIWQPYGSHITCVLTFDWISGVCVAMICYVNIGRPAWKNQADLCQQIEGSCHNSCTWSFWRENKTLCG